jgi:hypothetical protein
MIDEAGEMTANDTEKAPRAALIRQYLTRRPKKSSDHGLKAILALIAQCYEPRKPAALGTSVELASIVGC